MVLLTDDHLGAASKQPVQTQADGQAWEGLFQPFGQTVEGFEFAILLGRMFVWILNEFGHNGQSESIGQLMLCHMAGTCTIKRNISTKTGDRHDTTTRT